MYAMDKKAIIETNYIGGIARDSQAGFEVFPIHCMLCRPLIFGDDYNYV